jgi:hypothetical protein
MKQKVGCGLSTFATWVLIKLAIRSCSYTATADYDTSWIWDQIRTALITIGNIALYIIGVFIVYFIIVVLYEVISEYRRYGFLPSWEYHQNLAQESLERFLAEREEEGINDEGER